MQIVEFQSNSSISLADDYPEAVVTLAVSHTCDAARLLFGVVELVPRGATPPTPDQHRRRTEVPGRTRSLFRVICPTAVALRLRQMVAAGGPVDVAATLNAPSISLPPLAPQVMKEEPPWPCVAFCKGELPFFAGWHGQPRVHHTIPETRIDAADLLEREHDFEWISECFFFHAMEYPELLGSLHVIAPNPRYADLDVRRVAHPSRGAPEGIFLCFSPREGDDLGGLSVQVTSVRPTGSLHSHQIPVREALLRVDFDHPIDQVTVSVVDERRGLLEEAGPFMFWRGDADVTTSFVEPSDVPAPRTEALHELAVRDVRRRLAVGAALRSDRVAARALTVFGDRDSAWETLRAEILWQSHRFLLAVTPRLTADDIETLRAWAREGAAHLFVLLSEAPTTALGAVGQDDSAAYVELRCAREADRIAGGYIVTEGHLWSFTGALSDLGTRGTALHALPPGHALREQMYASWHAAALVERIDADEPFTLDAESLLARVPRRVA